MSTAAEPARPGAHPSRDGTAFVVHTTRSREVAVRLFDRSGNDERTIRLDPVSAGLYSVHVSGVWAGALYKFVLDGEEVPDPYARELPYGVHGPARVVKHAGEPALANPPPPASWILYELHVGTFSPEGTFRGAESRLDALVDLGVNAIELLPVASFAGERGWGYDGVSLYAPHAAYGSPDDLRSLVRAAHARGLAVVLDVVYNHFGPAGNYLARYAEEHFTSSIQTPWGPAPDFGYAPMRRLVLDNVAYWLDEFGFDGLRLDATHEIHDTSSRHVLRDITDLAHARTPSRRVFFEDDRNEPAVVTSLGADGVWADDFHHQVHVLLTGERDGYYRAYAPTTEALAATIRGGFTFTGQPYAPWNGKPRGRRADGLSPQNLVYCVQNHDQIGNRAFGTRLAHETSPEAAAAAGLLLLFLPQTPLLFMGQEWAASSPFLYFSAHEGELGRLVSKGRREEFQSFAAFADSSTRGEIPDPQSVSTFSRSKLEWAEREREPHARVLRTYRTMLKLRREDPVLSAPASFDALRVEARGAVLHVERSSGGAVRRLVVNFGEAEVDVATGGDALVFAGTWSAPRLGARSAVVLAG